jgi:hypothetical protein
MGHWRHPLRKPLAALLVITILGGASAPAQQSAAQPPAGSNWQHVQALPIGTELYVKAKGRSKTCKLKSTTANALTCNAEKQDLTFDRATIVSVKIARSGRSTLIGFAVGVGTGVAIGVGGCRGGWEGPCSVVYGGLLGAAGAIAGITTDFSRSTVYKAP